MLVVSDASPINVLVRISCIQLLPQLYKQVVIPTAVAEELSHGNTPSPIREWLSAKPTWLVIRSPSSTCSSEPRHRGEREAIALALELKADLLLADDKRARNIATEFGIRVTGTLGVLEEASDHGLIELKEVIDRLRQTDFHAGRWLFESVLSRDRERKLRGKQANLT